MLPALLVSLAHGGPIVTGEVGGESSSGNADNSFKLGAVEVTRTSRLVSFGPWLEFDPTANGEDSAELVVYQETAPGDWALLWTSGPLEMGPLGEFHPSPDPGLVLERGQRYALGVWLSEGNYYYRFDDPADRVNLGWATFQGAIWSPSDFDPTLPAELHDQQPDLHGYFMEITVEVLDVDGDGAIEGQDCDDADPLNFPGNLELCDGLDNDCTGVPDDPVVYVSWYDDRDSDGYGDPLDPTEICDGTRPAGKALLGTDCDDADPEIHPDHTEICDGIDQDCDSLTDEDPVYHEGWVDADLDGFGDPGQPRPWCEPEPPPGTATNDQDCDDSAATTHPLALERCDGLNNDCDLLIDEDLPVKTWWTDADGDGAGDRLLPMVACEAPPGAADNPQDCDDADPERFPASEESCDGKDNNCDGLTGGEGDFDGDGFLDCEDCRSADPDSWPGAPEDGCDGIDHDCDGDVSPSPDCDAAAEAPSDGGCGCASAPASPLSLLSWVGLALIGRRRGRAAA